MATRSGSRRSPLPVPPWTREQGIPTGVPYGSPSPFERDVQRTLPAPPASLGPLRGTTWAFTPIQDLHGFITPNGLFFERHHAGVPTIPPDQHRLVVHGWVRNCADGSVEAVLEGGAAPLAELIAFLRAGPPAARVDRLEESSETPLEGLQGFEIRR